jgi:hypothetical protein
MEPSTQLWPPGRGHQHPGDRAGRLPCACRFTPSRQLAYLACSRPSVGAAIFARTTVTALAKAFTPK